MKPNFLSYQAPIIKFIGLWIMFSLITIFFSGDIAEILRPILNTAIECLEPNVSSQQTLIKTNQGVMFRNEITFLQDIYRQEIPIAPKGSQFVAVASVFHAIAPLSLIMTSGFIFRLTFLSIMFNSILTLVFCLALILVTTPMILLSNIESQFYFSAINFAHKDLPSPLVMRWTVFMELGGQWLTTIIFAVINIALTQKIAKKLN